VVEQELVGHLRIKEMMEVQVEEIEKQLVQM
jgi:hypothetical protein